VTAVINFTIDHYTVSVCVGGMPLIYSDYVEHAVLHEVLDDTTSSHGTPLFFAVARSSGWPELVVTGTCDPGPESGFHPGFLLIPETDLFLAGAGTRLSAWNLSPVRRLWQDSANMGFRGWRRHGDIVLMSAECDFAAWSLDGRKLWSAFVEPPWSYEIRDDVVELDVMGECSRFSAAIGPDTRRR